MSPNFLMNSLRMKSKGEGSSSDPDLELSLGKRTQEDLNVGEGSQVRDPKKTKMESPPSSTASLEHYNILKPGEMSEDIPVEVIDGFKFGGNAKYHDGLTREEITSRCLKGMGQLLSDVVRIAGGFGSGGGRDEVDNLQKVLEQSEKEKAALREELSLLVHKYTYETPSVMRLKLEQSEKEKADLWKKVEMVYNLYETQSAERLRLEEEQKLLKAELQELKAREDKQVQNTLEMAKDDTANTFKEYFSSINHLSHGDRS